RLELVGFGPDDRVRVAALAPLVAPHIDEFVQAFFDHLSNFHEARALLDDAPLLDSARRLKKEHLSAMVWGVYGLPYAEERLRLGMLYAQVALDPCVFIGAFHTMTSRIGSQLVAEGDLDAFERYVSFKKIAFFDLSLIVDVIVYERARVILAQQDTIRQLSTPILRVRDRLLVLPIIGAVDLERERLLTEKLLLAVRTHRAAVVLLDITGVPAVDASVAK